MAEAVSSAAAAGHLSPLVTSAESRPKDHMLHGRQPPAALAPASLTPIAAAAAASAVASVPTSHSQSHLRVTPGALKPSSSVYSLRELSQRASDANLCRRAQNLIHRKLQGSSEPLIRQQLAALNEQLAERIAQLEGDASTITGIFKARRDTEVLDMFEGPLDLPCTPVSPGRAPLSTTSAEDTPTFAVDDRWGTLDVGLASLLGDELLMCVLHRAVPCPRVFEVSARAHPAGLTTTPSL